MSSYCHPPSIEFFLDRCKSCRKLLENFLVVRKQFLADPTTTINHLLALQPRLEDTYETLNEMLYSLTGLNLKEGLESRGYNNTNIIEILLVTFSIFEDKLINNIKMEDYKCNEDGVVDFIIQTWQDDDSFSF